MKNQAHTRNKFSLIYVAILATAILISFGIGYVGGWLGKTKEDYNFYQSNDLHKVYFAAQDAARVICKQDSDLQCDKMEISSISDISEAEIAPDGSGQYSIGYDVPNLKISTPTNINIVVSGSGKVLEKNIDKRELR